MADVYTGTSQLSNIVSAAVDRYIRAALRHTPTMRSLVDVHPVQADRPGPSITLYKRTDLAPATTPLSELTDPDFVGVPNPTGTTITLAEYGNATVSTIRAKNVAFSDIDKQQMDAVGFNKLDTLDILVRDVASTGTNVLYGGGKTSTVTVTNTDVITADLVRKSVTRLRANGAQPRRGELYGCYIHPDASYDLRRETAAASWNDSHKYAAPGLIWPGEIGVFEGAFFIETARTKKATDGAASANVYRTLILGKEAVAEANAIEPHTVIGTVADKLNRFFPLGWYGLLGWSRFREEALYRIESGSNINP